MADPIIITVANADLAALIQAAKATLAKIDALADTLAASVTSIQQDVKGVADTVNTAIPLIQADVKEAADALKTFKLKGPMGISGGSMS
jgi:hypothetical protein